MRRDIKKSQKSFYVIKQSINNNNAYHFYVTLINFITRVLYYPLRAYSRHINKYTYYTTRHTHTTQSKLTYRVT